jgi:hypothetical protein
MSMMKSECRRAKGIARWGCGWLISRARLVCEPSESQGNEGTLAAGQKENLELLSFKV